MQNEISCVCQVYTSMNPYLVIYMLLPIISFLLQVYPSWTTLKKHHIYIAIQENYRRIRYKKLMLVNINHSAPHIHKLRYSNTCLHKLWFTVCISSKSLEVVFSVIHLSSCPLVDIGTTAAGLSQRSWLYLSLLFL